MCMGVYQAPYPVGCEHLKFHTSQHPPPQANLSVHRTDCCPALIGPQPSISKEFLVEEDPCRQQEGSRCTRENTQVHSLQDLQSLLLRTLFYSGTHSLPMPRDGCDPTIFCLPPYFIGLLLGRCIALNLWTAETLSWNQSWLLRKRWLCYFYISPTQTFYILKVCGARGIGSETIKQYYLQITATSWGGFNLTVQEVLW